MGTFWNNTKRNVKSPINKGDFVRLKKESSYLGEEGKIYSVREKIFNLVYTNELNGGYTEDDFELIISMN